MNRKPLSLKTKLASALLTMRRADENGQLVLIIPFEDAQKMTADQICSLFHFDHYPIPHAHDGPDEAWNLVPRLIAEHREKTAKVDRPMMAHVDRIRDREENGPQPSQMQSRGFRKPKPQRSATKPLNRSFAV